MTIQKLQNIDQVSGLCKNELDTRLTKEGYEITKEEHHSESFGSRYWVWTNYKAKHCFRLIWDGRDEWFILQESPFIYDSEKVAWADVTIVPFDGNVSNTDYWKETMNAITTEIK